MNQEIGKWQKFRLIRMAFGLGLIFSAAWASLLVFMPSGTLLTIINYSLYFMSLSIVGIPTFSVIQLYLRKSYSIILAVIIWAVWIFGVRTLFVWLISAMGAGK